MSIIFDGDVRDFAPDQAAKRYKIIYMDPPWKLSGNSKARPGRNPMRHYDCMSDAEITAMPVNQLAAESAVLFMWTTVPMLRRSLAIPEAWGFQYVSGFCWDKEYPGTGHWIRNQHEHLLIYRRGKGLRPENKAPFSTSMLRQRKRAHSRKPSSFKDQIDSIWPDAAKLEIFARAIRSGWDQIGNEIQKFDHA